VDLEPLDHPADHVSGEGASGRRPKVRHWKKARSCPVSHRAPEVAVFDARCAGVDHHVVGGHDLLGDLAPTSPWPIEPLLRELGNRSTS